MAGTTARRVLILSAAAVAFSFGFLAPAIYRGRAPNRNLVPRVSTDSAVYRAQFRHVAGPQYVLVFLGSSSCKWSAADSLPFAVERLKIGLANAAKERRASFKAIGVAVDWSIRAGSGFIDQFGSFDEVSIGGSWTNSIVSEWMWRAGIKPGTPTIAIYKRTIAEPYDSSRFEISDMQLVTSSKGAAAIAALSRGDLRMLLDPDSQNAIRRNQLKGWR